MVAPTQKHRAAALALALMLGLSGLARAQTIAVPPAIGIDNFARVNDTYYRGAQPEGDDYAALAALGVKTVINLTSDDAVANEQAMVEKNGMRYINIPWDPTLGIHRMTVTHVGGHQYLLAFAYEYQPVISPAAREQHDLAWYMLVLQGFTYTG